jgi:hypothetical protein
LAESRRCRSDAGAGDVSKAGPAADCITATSDKGKFDLRMMGSVVTKILAGCRVPLRLVR